MARTRRSGVAQPRGAGGGLADEIRRVMQRNSELEAENARLNAEMDGIRVVLSRGLGGVRMAATPGTRRGRQAALPALPALSDEPPVKRQRRPITDPAMLEKRRAALMKARAARAEKLAAARAPVNGSVGHDESEADSELAAVAQEA